MGPAGGATGRAAGDDAGTETERFAKTWRTRRRFSQDAPFRRGTARWTAGLTPERTRRARQRQSRAKSSHETPARHDSKRAPKTPPHIGRMPLPCTVVAIVVALAQQATLALCLLETTANVVAIAQTRLTNDPHLYHLHRHFLRDSSPQGCPSKASFLRRMNESPYRGTPTDTHQGTRGYTDTWHILAR